MKIFALIGVNNYGTGRVIAAVQAESLAEACFFLGGEMYGAGETNRLKAVCFFPPGSECGVFVPGPCTAEILASAAGCYVSEMAKDLDQIYVQGLRLGSVPAPVRRRR